MNEVIIKVPQLEKISEQLDAILEHLEGRTAISGTIAPGSVQTRSSVQETPTATQDTLQAAPEPVEAPAEPTPEPRQVTLADIQHKIVKLTTAGKKAEAREIVTAYAAKVSAIPADKLAEVLEKLTALEG